MKKTFKLEGLGCANCAAKMERSIQKLDGVSFASVNFLTTKMVIEAEESQFDEILKSANDIIKRIEPDVIVKKA